MKQINRFKQKKSLRIKSKKLFSPFKKVTILIWSVIGGLGILISIWGGWLPISDTFKTQKERAMDEFDSGDLKPIDLQKTYVSPETVQHTSNRISIDSLFSLRSKFDNAPPIKGLFIKDFKHKNVIINTGNIQLMDAKNFFSDDSAFNVLEISKASNCSDQKLLLSVRNDRLYVSVEFKDLLKEETVGFIEYNHWNLYKANRLLFSNTDSTLEVRDKQNNVVFTISVITDERGNPKIDFAGYFISPNDIFVIKNKSRSLSNNICISKTETDWKRKAASEILQIEPVYTKRHIPTY